MVILIKKASLPACVTASNFTPVVLVKGRVLLVTFLHMGLSTSFCNVHNHGLSGPDLSAISSGLSPFISSSLDSPASSSLFLLGDLNAIDDHRVAFSLAAAAPTHERAQNGHKPAFWRKLLDKAIEIKYTDFSHFINLASNKLNSLTRGYWFTQPWLCTSLHVSATVLDDPVKLQLKKFSDHAPTSFSIRVSQPKQSSFPKIPNHIAKSLEFKKHVTRTVLGLDFSSLNPFAALDLLKDVFREASKVATEKLYKGDAWSPELTCMALGSAARAFTQQNTTLASTLLNSNSSFKQFMRVDGNKVHLTSSATFSSKYCVAK